MFEKLTIPAGFNKVEDSDLSAVLSNSGNRGAGYFFANSEIIVPDDARVFGRERDSKDSEGNARTLIVPYIEASINGQARLVPFSAFRRFPAVDAAEFASKTTLMQQLFVGSDAERLSTLRGKTIIVSEMVPGKARDWSASPVGTPQDEVKYYETKFPVLDEKRS